jgi:hypothetical protein
MLRSLGTANEVVWIDNFGLDSQYDYDPFWAKCGDFSSRYWNIADAITLTTSI